MIDPMSYVFAWTNDNFFFHPIEKRYKPLSPNAEFRSIQRLILDHPDHVLSVISLIIQNLVIDQNFFSYKPEFAIEILKIVAESNLDKGIYEQLWNHFEQLQKHNEYFQILIQTPTVPADKRIPSAEIAIPTPV